MNTTQAINTILNNTQFYLGKVCRVTLKNGDVRYVNNWDACAGIAVSLDLIDNQGVECGRIKVDRNNLKDYITHVGNEEIL